MNNNIEIYIDMLQRILNNCKQEIENMQDKKQIYKNLYNFFKTLSNIYIDATIAYLLFLITFSLKIFLNFSYSICVIISSLPIITHYCLHTIYNIIYKVKITKANNQINVLTNLQNLIEQKIKIFEQIKKENIDIKKTFTKHDIELLEKQYNNDINEIKNSNKKTQKKINNLILNEYNKDNECINLFAENKINKDYNNHTNNKQYANSIKESNQSKYYNHFEIENINQKQKIKKKTLQR